MPGTVRYYLMTIAGEDKMYLGQWATMPNSKQRRRRKKEEEYVCVGAGLACSP